MGIPQGSLTVTDVLWYAAPHQEAEQISVVSEKAKMQDAGLHIQCIGDGIHPLNGQRPALAEEAESS